MVRIILGGLGEFIGPSVDDWVAIDVIDAGDDALLECMTSQKSRRPQFVWVAMLLGLVARQRELAPESRTDG